MKRVVPRGNVRKLILLVGEIQHEIGKARGCARNDRDPDQLKHEMEALDAAFEKCLEIRNLYAPIA